MNRIQSSSTSSRQNSTSSLEHCLNVIRLLLLVALFALMLAGCATSSPQPEKVFVSVPCPEPQPLPQAITESSLPDASAYSRKVSSWLARVRSFLSELQQTRMQSAQGDF